MSLFARFSLIGILVALSGCGLPPAAVVVSYAVDGISYIASGKSVTDHAISAAVDEDCAIYRVVQNRPICHPEVHEPGPIAIASAAAASGLRIWGEDGEFGAFYFVGIEASAPQLRAAADAWTIDTQSDIAETPVQLASARPEWGGRVAGRADTLIGAHDPVADFDSRRIGRIVAELSGFAPGTEICALLQKNGTLEIFAYQPTLLNPTRDLRLVARFEDFDRNRSALDGVRVNGTFFRVEDIVV